MQVNSGTPSERSSVPLQLPLSPMRLFVIGVDALGAMVHRPQHADPGKKLRPAAYGHFDFLINLPTQLIRVRRKMIPHLGLATSGRSLGTTELTTSAIA